MQPQLPRPHRTLRTVRNVADWPFPATFCRTSESDDQKLLTLLNARDSMQELVGGHPAQYQRGRFGGVERGVDEDDLVGLQRAVLRVGSGHCQVGNALSDGPRSHAMPKLHDLTDEIVAKDERRLLLEVGVLAFAQHDVGELNTCGEHLHEHLAGAGLGNGALDDEKSVRASELAQQQDTLLCRKDHGFSSPWVDGGLKSVSRGGRSLSVGRRLRVARGPSGPMSAAEGETTAGWRDIEERPAAVVVNRKLSGCSRTRSKRTCIDAGQRSNPCAEWPRQMK